jgi:hypothetical protein
MRGLLGFLAIIGLVTIAVAAAKRSQPLISRAVGYAE